jgi:DNA-binding response OmpR family regulator
MSSIAPLLLPATRTVFKQLFNVDSSAVRVEGHVSPEGIKGDLASIIGTDEPFFFSQHFRKIMQPATFARENNGFLARQAAELAKQLRILEPKEYERAATTFLASDTISAQHAMVIAEAVSRYIEKLAAAKPKPEPIIPAPTVTVQAAPVSKPAPAPQGPFIDRDIAQIEARRRAAYQLIRNTLNDDAAHTIQFADATALNEDFCTPSLALVALQRLGFEQVGQTVNGSKVTMFKHTQSGLRINMTEKEGLEPTFALGFGLLEGMFVPGTYEDLPASSAHKISITIPDAKPLQRRIAFYHIKISADDLPQRLRELEALVNSEMMLLTKYVKPDDASLISSKIQIEKGTVPLIVNTSTRTVGKLLALNGISVAESTPAPTMPAISASKQMAVQDDAAPFDSAADVVNCVIVGMQGTTLTSLLQLLRGDVKSPCANITRAVTMEMHKALGHLPRFDVQLVRPADGQVDYAAASNRLSQARTNILCIGVDERSHAAACRYLKAERAGGNGTLAVAIHDKGMAPRMTAALNEAGFDRVVSSNEDPAVIEILMQSLVRNMKMRANAVPGFESYGPLHIEWDSFGNRTSRRLQGLYVGDDLTNLKRVQLTNSEAQIMERLVQTPSVGVSKDALINHLYGGRDEPEPKIIDVFICKLRKKIILGLRSAGYVVSLQDNPIETQWGKGYFFNGNFGQDIAGVNVQRPAAPSSTPAATSANPT